MNLPDIPGQIISGEKAAKVVKTDANTGVNILSAAFVYASIRDWPLSINLSAYSTITIPPSISIPKPSNIPNITKKLNS